MDDYKHPLGRDAVAESELPQPHKASLTRPRSLQSTFPSPIPPTVLDARPSFPEPAPNLVPSSTSTTAALRPSRSSGRLHPTLSIFQHVENTITTVRSPNNAVSPQLSARPRLASIATSDDAKEATDDEYEGDTPSASQCPEFRPMIPKHSNPFALLSSTAIVSRAALRDSDDEDGPTQPDSEHAQMLARLENILKRTIQDVLPQASQVEGPRDEDAPRKKKRRKIDKEQEEAKRKLEGEEAAPAVCFRLFSGSDQPKPILLAPKIKPWVAPEGPSREDTAEEAERRASRARSIAVDYAWVMAESMKLNVPPPCRSKSVVHLHADISPVDAPLLLLQRTKSASPKPPHIVQSNPEAEIEPSPHAHDTSESCCPIIQVKTSAADTGKSERRKGRRGKPRQKPPIQATFWRPPPGLGGKALGYAWGYAGSHPLQPGEGPHYTR
ncbi:hypothetical protein V8D89_001424, partial [Ganoderma adspersum]